jgi:hypothetical protein
MAKMARDVKKMEAGRIGVEFGMTVDVLSLLVGDWLWWWKGEPGWEWFKFGELESIKYRRQRGDFCSQAVSDDKLGSCFGMKDLRWI